MRDQREQFHRRRPRTGPRDRSRPWLLTTIVAGTCVILFDYSAPLYATTPPTVEAVLERAAELVDGAYSGESCVQGSYTYNGSTVGCLECGLPDVLASTDCAETILSSSSGSLWTAHWRVGECSFTATTEIAFFGTEWNEARTLALAVLQAGGEFGLIPACEMDPFDAMLVDVVRERFYLRISEFCFEIDPFPAHRGEGCFEIGLPDVGPSEDCPWPLQCETTGEFPYITGSCEWRAGTFRFGAGSMDDTPYTAASSLASAAYDAAVRHGLIPPCPPTPTMNPRSDINRDNGVDAKDLLLLIADWRQKTGPSSVK